MLDYRSHSDVEQSKRAQNDVRARSNCRRWNGRGPPDLWADTSGEVKFENRPPDFAAPRARSENCCQYFLDFALIISRPCSAKPAATFASAVVKILPLNILQFRVARKNSRWPFRVQAAQSGLEYPLFD